MTNCTCTPEQLHLVGCDCEVARRREDEYQASKAAPKAVYIANWETFGNFCCTCEERHEIDDWGFSSAAAPSRAHVLLDFDEGHLATLKQMAIDDYAGQCDFDTYPQPEEEAELEQAVWHTGGWVLGTPWGGAEPKKLGWQEWTLASPDWVADGKDGVEPILRLTVEQHRVF